MPPVRQIRAESSMHSAAGGPHLMQAGQTRWSDQAGRVTDSAGVTALEARATCAKPRAGRERWARRGRRATAHRGKPQPGKSAGRQAGKRPPAPARGGRPSSKRAGADDAAGTPNRPDATCGVCGRTEWCASPAGNKRRGSRARATGGGAPRRQRHAAGVGPPGVARQHSPRVGPRTARMEGIDFQPSQLRTAHPSASATGAAKRQAAVCLHPGMTCRHRAKTALRARACSRGSAVARPTQTARQTDAPEKNHQRIHIGTTGQPGIDRSFRCRTDMTLHFANARKPATSPRGKNADQGHVDRPTCRKGQTTAVGRSTRAPRRQSSCNNPGATRRVDAQPPRERQSKRPRGQCSSRQRSRTKRAGTGARPAPDSHGKRRRTHSSLERHSAATERSRKTRARSAMKHRTGGAKSIGKASNAATPVRHGGSARVRPTRAHGMLRGAEGAAPSAKPGPPCSRGRAERSRGGWRPVREGLTRKWWADRTACRRLRAAKGESAGRGQVGRAARQTGTPLWPEERGGSQEAVALTAPLTRAGGARIAARYEQGKSSEEGSSGSAPDRAKREAGGRQRAGGARACRNRAAGGGQGR